MSSEELSDALLGLIKAADSGEWHLCEDCEVEQRAHECKLCIAIAHAREVFVNHKGKVTYRWKSRPTN